LISINKAYAGFGTEEEQSRFDWNSLLGGIKFKNFSKEFFPKADSLVDYVTTFAESQNIKVKYG